MADYARTYRWGITPWEGYGEAAAASIAARLDREESDRSRPLGRALDLGCGRGQFTPELGRRGWEAVDVTDLPSAGLGTFDFFLDIGCFQGFDAGQRDAVGRGVSALARPGATVLVLAFGPGRLRSVIGGVSRAEVEAALTGWETLAVDDADTAGLGWPMRTTSPRWYRLRRLP